MAARAGTALPLPLLMLAAAAAAQCQYPPCYTPSPPGTCQSPCKVDADCTRCPGHHCSHSTGMKECTNFGAGAGAPPASAPPAAVPQCDCAGVAAAWRTACAAANVLTARYFQAGKGEYTTAGRAIDHWRSAEALRATTEFGRLSGCTGLAAVAGAVHAKHSAERVELEMAGSWDDQGWWIDAYVDAYHTSGDAAYLTDAQTVFDHVDAKAWDESKCGGGYWWNSRDSYKNAITSELGLLNAARLHAALGSTDTKYLGRAQRMWAWFNTSGLINAGGLVNDGLTGDCNNNGQTTWTYNQGVVLGGLAALHGATGDASLLAAARRIADAVIAGLSPNGTLTEPKITDPDQQQFKGIFARNLRALAAELGADGAPYRAYLRRNAAVLAARGVAADGSGRYGATWQGPVDATDGSKPTQTGASPQASALDLLNAAAWAATAP